jgi:hypothetical protein
MLVLPRRLRGRPAGKMSIGIGPVKPRDAPLLDLVSSCQPDEITHFFCAREFRCSPRW